jgi:hypothetical protein
MPMDEVKIKDHPHHNEMILAHAFAEVANFQIVIFPFPSLQERLLHLTMNQSHSTMQQIHQLDLDLSCSQNHHRST